MEKYIPQEIEKKWQQIWEETGLYQAHVDPKKEKYYCLDMFPYPSGSGLHVGHWRGYVLSDMIARYQRLNGKNVLHPMGFDAFGLPAENAAIKAKSHPEKFTDQAIVNFRRQIRQIGTMIDWSREINTSKPGYYKWTQWLFLQLYKNGLAYKKKAPVNWCPSCQTVLANEQVVSGQCERCSSTVIKKDLTQWFFKITDYAEDLLNDLDGLDWPEKTKTLQRNWIGRSEGAMVKFGVHNSDQKIEVFTTRPDTLCGATFMVLSPEHPMVDRLVTSEQKSEIDDYREKVKKENDIDRVAIDKEKTGIFTGAYAINPINFKQMPIWISDYVLMGYGTGAVMCVPAHDQRDFDFATKFGLDITQVIAPYFPTTSGDDAIRADKPTVKRKMITAIVKHWQEDKIFVLDWEKFNWHSFILGGIDDGETAEEAAKREVIEESGYSDIKSIRKIGFETHSQFFARHKDENRYSISDCFVIELGSDKYEKPEIEHTKNHTGKWLNSKEVADYINLNNNVYYWDIFLNGEKSFEEHGIVINSDKYNDLKSLEAKKKITSDLEKDTLAFPTINYHLRDWLISRQRYWGAPIPMVYCEKCGEVPVPEDQLPVELPSDVEFSPKGESPLKSSNTFTQTTCPDCGGQATRETDTMDTFVCSSWYYLRYTDPNNDKSFADIDKLKYWMPVDFYFGGIEHAVLHLLYARFISKALTKLNLLPLTNNGEPFQKLFNIGMIYLNGAKMSKSKGNVVSPDELIEKYGTDALRGYELFIGPSDLDSEWQVQGIVGISRFLEKVYSAFQRPFTNSDQKNPLIEKTIKTVTLEIESVRPNTAISHLMELFNALKKDDQLSKIDAEKITILLSPFFPHLAEELWQKIGHDKSIFFEKWPQFDEASTIKEMINLPIQINGKIKDIIEISPRDKEEEIKQSVLELPKIKEALGDKIVIKVIYVSGKVLNFVVE